MQKKLSLPIMIMVIISAVCVVVYAAVGRGNPGIYNSPDEAMHAIASLQFASEGALGVDIPAHLQAYQFLDPRATFLHGSSVVPSGFLGLPLLYGFFIRLLGEGALVWLTPLVGVLLAWGVYALARLVFYERLAQASFALTLLLPPVWYYASRGLFHNILFSALFVWGLVMTLYGAKKTQDKEPGFLIAAGVLLGFSLWVRLSEVFLIAVSLLVVGVCYRTQLRPRRVLVTCGIVAAFAFAYVLLAYLLLGSPLPGGYGVAAREGGGVMSTLMPFGFHPRAISFNVYHYWLRLFWWITIPALLGVTLFFVRFKNEPQLRRLYFWLTFFCGLVLVGVLYGNWITYDNPNPLLTTITNAHIRYWIPLFALCVPWAVYALERALHYLVPAARPTAIVLGSLALVYLSTTAVWRGPDGLGSVRASLAQGERLRQELAVIVAPTDLVIVDREDKFLFPQFFVSRRFDVEGIHRLLENGHRVWYARDVHPPAILEAQQLLAEHNLALEFWYEWPPHGLWRINAIPAASDEGG